MLPRLRARGLVNTRNTCFGMHLATTCKFSPILEPVQGIRRFEGAARSRGPETGGGTTPLVDATVRFFKEFMVEESASTQRQSQPATGRTSRAADEEKKDNNVADSFEPRYLYDAMKEKRQLRPLLDGQQQDAEEFLCLYLDALDEELPAVLPRHQSVSSALDIEKPDSEASQAGQAAVVANLVESPTTRIFGGKFRLPVARQTSPTLFQKTGDHSISTSRRPHARLPVQSTYDGPSGLSDVSQQMLISALPHVLVLHLNRVRYDAAAGGLIKIGKSIQFGPDLEIPLDIMVPNAQPRSEPPHYKLYGVLYHHGESAGNGHYTLDVLRPNGDGDTGEDWCI
ncbi:hypothetical protein BGY98DRAFT_1180882 [Russula aff. rugulosa BPL654]|nr:hypothetical protein BGY98DRAFT_1180882 [Russula aff. rugulosa BPL654]